MNEQNEKDKKKKVRLNSEKRFYLFTAIGCALAMVAIVVIAVAVSGGNEVQNVGGVNSSYGSAVENSSTGNNQGDIGGEEPVGFAFSGIRPATTESPFILSVTECTFSTLSFPSSSI